MAMSAVDATRDFLLAIPANEVRPFSRASEQLPGIFAAILKSMSPGRREALSSIGYDLAELERLTTLSLALNELLSSLANTQNLGPTNSRAAIVARALPIRDGLVRACRYHLRHQNDIDVRLDTVSRSTGAANLAFDLDVLALMIESNAAAFATNRSFDVAARVAEARAMATEIRGVVATLDAVPESVEVSELRDRAATALSRGLRDLAAASEFCLPDDAQFANLLRQPR